MMDKIFLKVRFALKANCMLLAHPLIQFTIAGKDVNIYQYIYTGWKLIDRLNTRSPFEVEFVMAFENACSKLGVKRSDVLRKAMQDTIEKASKI